MKPTDAQREQARELCPLDHESLALKARLPESGCIHCKRIAAALAAADAAGYERGLAAGERRERRALMDKLEELTNWYGPSAQSDALDDARKEIAARGPMEE